MIASVLFSLKYPLKSLSDEISQERLFYTQLLSEIYFLLKGEVRFAGAPELVVAATSPEISTLAGVITKI
jgi:hypothetical protein